MSEYWGFEDNENYDEDGFAKELPADSPHRDVKALMDKLAGITPPVKIRKDYTKEFSEAYPDIVSRFTHVMVTTYDPILTHLNIRFDLRFMLEQQRYAYHYEITRYSVDSQEEYDRARQWLFLSLAKLMSSVIIKACAHEWQRYPPDFPTHVKCSKCGLEQDTPEGNRDWSEYFK